MPTQLHELLAVEKSLAETATNITRETTKTLATKETLFSGMVKSNQIFAEDKQHLTAATEHKEVQSTVYEQLDFLKLNVGRYWDLIIQKEEANQRAKGDIIIDGEVIASDVPSIVLLGLEKKLHGLIETFKSLPTLDSSKSWTRAEDYERANVWEVRHPIERQQTTTQKTYIEASPATQHHKAQLVEDIKTDVIGKYIVTDFSGTITSIDKANKLERLTKLIRAVSAARQRANCVEINTELKVGDVLFDYILG
jgi:hypothetical protein